MYGLYIGVDFSGLDLRRFILAGRFVSCDFRGAVVGEMSGEFIDCLFD